jgi:2-methylcitrate dehydratase
MDLTSSRLVEFVGDYSATKLTDSLVEAVNYTMLDSIAAMFTGFESEPARINARLSRSMRGDMKCTVWGYGIVTTPEMAAFSNACMVRHTDYNTSPHNTEMFPGILAVAEAMHSSGPDTLAALVTCYEVVTALGATGQGGYEAGGFDSQYHAIAVALAVGQLMKLNKDKLGNAASLALVPHMPLYVCHTGVQSMWKGCHSSQLVKDGVWAALMAREGMTGPCEPFEGRDGYLAHVGPFLRDFHIPANQGGLMGIEQIHGKGGGFKRIASEGSTQTFHEYMAKDFHDFAKPEEIASIDVDFPFFWWQEICDPPKWDPRNRETADHSMPYNIARGIMDGGVYVDSFTPEKYMDPVARGLMNKITIHPNPETVIGQITVTVRKKDGTELTKKNTARQTPMSHEDIVAKYYRAADYMKIDKTQAKQIQDQWMNLHAATDVSETVKILAKFGQPKPL